MRHILLITFLAINVISCTSETEDKGIKKVSDFYQCHISYVLGTSTSTSEGTKKYFEIDLSESKTLNAFPAWLIGKNAARLFYTQLNEEEKENYDEIILNVSQDLEGNKSQTEVIVSTEELKLVTKKTVLFEESSEALKKNNFDTFHQMCDAALITNIDKDEIENGFDELNSKLGNTIEYQLLGYQVGELKNDTDTIPIIQFFGIQQRDSTSLNYQITVSQEEKNNKLYAFKFE